jgi:hypothetical protein
MLGGLIMFEHRYNASVWRNRFAARIAKGAFVACLGLWASAGYTAPDVADDRVDGLVANGEPVVDLAVVVTNDQCRDQIEVTDGNIAYTNVGATTDGPEEPQACRFNFFDNISSDIWYRYTATCNGELSVDLCESDFDTKVAVYGGRQCPVTSPPLACNDDFCGIQSRATLPVQQGSYYTIRVGGYFGAQGTGVMKLHCSTVIPAGACCGAVGQCLGTMTQTQCQEQGGVWHEGTECGIFVCPIPTPANDACDDCTRLLTGIPFNGTTLGTTGTDISSCTPGDAKDVWHCWTADCTGRALFGTCGSGFFDTSLAIYDACGGNQLACNDDGCGSPFVNSKIDLDVTEGTTYYVRVSGASGASGNYHLTVDPCRNACCINNGTCQLVIPAQCTVGGGRPAGPGTFCLGDQNSNGVDDACETCIDATITDADPPSGTLDARQPNPQNFSLPRQGIGASGGPSVQAEPITIQVSPGIAGAQGCFRLCETLSDSLLGPNGIGSVTDLGGGAYRIFLHHAITAGGVTTISYLGDGSFVQYLSHPANVNGDMVAAPVDILDLIDDLNDVLVPPLTTYRCDLDRSDLCAPADILTLIDLLNGAGEWDPWNGSQRPVNTRCP